MDDAWKEAKARGRIQASTIYGDADPDQLFDTCKGCGRCMHLNKDDMCGTIECTDTRIYNALKLGIVLKINNTYIFDRDKVAVFRAPQPTAETIQTLRNRGLLKDPLPTCAQCSSIPRPDDTLCIHHRLEKNLKEHKEAPKHYQSKGSDTELPSRRQRRFGNLRNRIKGMDNINVKVK